MAYCVRCGRPESEGDHGECRARVAYEPPRYCPQCARRMVVQVTPSGWSARCNTHGNVPAAGDGRSAPPAELV
ncbi:MAG: hypothetical protein ACRDRZ_15290 [Pseudonocardiaceae bacterium]